MWTAKSWVREIYGISATVSLKGALMRPSERGGPLEDRAVGGEGEKGRGGGRWGDGLLRALRLIAWIDRTLFCQSIQKSDRVIYVRRVEPLSSCQLVRKKVVLAGASWNCQVRNLDQTEFQKLSNTAEWRRDCTLFKKLNSTVDRIPATAHVYMEQ